MSKTFPHSHLLGIEQLSVTEIDEILGLSEHYFTQNRGPNKTSAKLNGKTVVNLFYEASTRTRASFEIAAKRLGADVINISVENSSTKKGETLLDTALNLDAMGIDALIMRHNENNAPHNIAEKIKASVLNAGDGTNEHPTQALLDFLTIKRAVERRGKKLSDLKIAICGDVAHSRVARSNIILLNKFDVQVTTVAPPGFQFKDLGNLKIKMTDDIVTGIQQADIVMMLRTQYERLIGESFMPPATYRQQYGLDHDKLKAAKPDVIILHPGPVNRGVEISDALMDDKKYSVILEQVETGVAVRMAVLDLLLGTK